MRADGKGIEGPWDLVVVGHGFAGLSIAASFLEWAEGRAVRVAILDRGSFDDREGSSAWTTASSRLDDEGHLARDWGEYVHETDGDQANDGCIDSFRAHLDQTLDWVRAHGVETSVVPDVLVPGMFARNHSFLTHGGEDFVERYTEVVDRLGSTYIYEVDLVGLEREPSGPVAAVGVRMADGSERRLETKAVVLACDGFEGDRKELGRRTPGGETLDTVSPGTRVNTGAGIMATVAIGAAKAGQYAGDRWSRSTPGTQAPSRSPAPGGGASSWTPTGSGSRTRRRGASTSSSTGWRGRSWPGASVPSQSPTHRFAPAFRLSRTPTGAASSRSRVTTCPSSQTSWGSMPPRSSRRSPPTTASYDRPFASTILDGKRTEGLEPPKSSWEQPMTEPPFEAWPLVAHICFTFEGMKVDATTQVLAEQDARIPGLHAAQEVVGILYGNLYPLGSSGLRSMTFGRLARQDSRPRSPRSPRPDRRVANLTRVSSCWRHQASRSNGVCKSTEFAPCCWLSKDRGTV